MNLICRIIGHSFIAHIYDSKFDTVNYKITNLEEPICKRIFFLVLDTNWNFNETDLNNSNLTISDIENYPENCEVLGFNKLPLKPITLESNETIENIRFLIGNFLDTSIKIGRWDIGEYDNKTIDFLKNFIEIERQSDRDRYDLVGIKISVFMLIGIFITLIYLIKRKMKKGLK